MSRPRLFMEAPAGLAAVSLRLHGGPKCKPPLSRMGNKVGFAAAVLDRLGLADGSGADAYLWAEADQDVASLIRCYPDAPMLRRVAEIIRGWANEDPRALWERLRLARAFRTPIGPAEQTAGWVVQGMWSYRQGDPSSGGPVLPGDRRQDTSAAAAAACNNLATFAENAAAWAWIQARTYNGAEKSGASFAPDHSARGVPVWGAVSQADLAARFDGMAHDVAGVAIVTAWEPQPGRYVGPDFSSFTSISAGGLSERFEGMAQQVAAAAAAAARTMPQAQARGATEGDFLPRVAPSGTVRYAPDAPASGFESVLRSGWPPVAILPRIPDPGEVAAWLGTPGDLQGVIVYMDPPYVNTTGYAHDLPRAQVVSIARRYAALGAVVAISEAEPIHALGRAWKAVRITEQRVGQKRTFSKQKEEWLTISSGSHGGASRS